MDRVELIEKSADKNGMDAITATSDAYPKNLLDAGRTDALYTMGDVDLNVPTLGLIIGGNSKPTAADQNDALAIASEAAETGYAVALHLSGDTSALIAKTIAEMPQEQRPRILLVVDGHPNTMGKDRTRTSLNSSN